MGLDPPTPDPPRMASNPAVSAEVDLPPDRVSGTGASMEAFRAVYDEHFRFVWRSLRRLGVREHDVPDAAQEVFLVVHRKLGSFEGRSKMTTWLYGIAYRVAHDRQKLAHTRRSVADADLVAEQADEAADLGEHLERRQAALLLERIMDEMPLEQRAVFAAFELEGMGGEDIAEMLDVPLGTVYSRLRLARDVFKKNVDRFRARERFTSASGAERGGAR